jgi:glycosyltransferase involved in cell wall biosynthesis
MHVTLVNHAFDEQTTDPDVLLHAYGTLTGWSDALTTAGATVSVVQRFGRDAEIVRKGVTYKFLQDGIRGDPQSKLVTSRVNRAVAGLAPDIVHVNGLNIPVQIWWLRRSVPHTAIVVQDHGGGTPGPGGWRSAMRRITMRSADAFFFTAAAQAEVWRSIGAIRREQPVFEVLEASTDLRAIDRETARKATGLEGDPAILWVGRLNANKSPLVVLDAFERVLMLCPRATLSLIFSADDLRAEIEARLAVNRALASRVKLIGQVGHERLPQFYSAADAFVLGSHHEGSGYALIEACACGVPPAVTDIPAFRVITGNGRIGALWPVDRADRCADALARIVREDRETSRRAVVEHFERALSWSVVARQAVDAYASIITAKRAGGPAAVRVLH